MLRREFLHFLAIAAAVVASDARAENDEGYDGLVLSIDTEGFFLNPIVLRIHVFKVEPGSPASTIGIVPGDQIVAIEGKLISGRRANELRPHLAKKVGEVTNLALERKSGERYTVALISAKQPQPKP